MTWHDELGLDARLFGRSDGKVVATSPSKCLPPYSAGHGPKALMGVWLSTTIDSKTDSPALSFEQVNGRMWLRVHLLWHLTFHICEEFGMHVECGGHTFPRPVEFGRRPPIVVFQGKLFSRAPHGRASHRSPPVAHCVCVMFCATCHAGMRAGVMCP